MSLDTRTRGDGPDTTFSADTTTEASPHTRGWTRHDERRAIELEGFPAHAGMDPI